ncbi:MAG: hypothetical protein ACTSQ8_18075 [Candidatus Helarchaeota archaeon]
MTLINIRPREIYSNARELILKANRIEESIKEVDKQLNTLSEEVFSGESASRLREDYKKYRAQLLSSSKTMRYFAYSLIEIAHDLEAADQKQFFSLGIFAGVSGILTGFLSKIIPGWGNDKPKWDQFGGTKDVEDAEANSEGYVIQDETGESGISLGSNESTHEIQYDGAKPAPGMDSTYGKPGQVPLDAPVKSDPSNRSAELSEDVINQFAVGNNPRYAKDNHTYCNTFAGDVARAMGVPLPQKNEWGLNPKDRATVGFPQLYDYFTNSNAPVKASDAGWVELGKNDLLTLESHVNSGKMAVVVNNGHISVIKPDQAISGFDNILISQAGATNSNNLTLSEGFGSTQEPRIFIID